MIQIGSWSFVPDNPIGVTFGINGANVYNAVDPQLFLDVVALTASRIRFNIVREIVEPTQGNFNWSGMDSMVYNANKVGIRVTLIARGFQGSGPPAWASVGSPCAPGGTKTYTTPAAYLEYAVAIAKRYSGDGNPANVTYTGGKFVTIGNGGTGPALQCDNIEIGNEDFDVGGGGSNPDNGGCGDGLRYVFYVRQIIPAMRKSVSQGGGGWVPRGNFLARIGKWGNLPRIQNHVKDLYTKMCNPNCPAALSDPMYNAWNPSKSGNSVFGFDATLGCQMLDYANFHNYSDIYNSSATDYDHGQECDDIRHILDAAGNTKTPIWCTEFGETGPSGGASAASQAKFYSANADGSGPGVLATLKLHGCQHGDLFTINYAIAGTAPYTGESKAIACKDSASSSGYIRFQSFSNIQNFLKADNGAWAAQPVPRGFGTSAGPPPPPPTASFTLTPSSLSYAATVGGANPSSQPVTISNTGTLDGTWGIAITGGAWLAASLSSGSLNAGASASVSMTATTGSLTANTYTATITVTFTPTGQSPLTATCAVTFAVSTSSGTTVTANPGDDLVAKVNSLSPGYTLILNDGTYLGTSTTQCLRIVGKNGTSTNPITIMAKNDGKAVIDGQGNYTPIFIQNSSWITIQGLHAQNSVDNTIYIYGQAQTYASSNITLRRCTATHSATQNHHVVYAAEIPGTANILFEDCAAWGPGRYMFIAYHCDTVTFRRCYAYWNTITNNINQPRACFACYGSKNCTFENCIGTHALPYQNDDSNYYDAFWHESDDLVNFPSSNCKLYGCIFFGNYEGEHLNENTGANAALNNCYYETPAWTGPAYTDRLSGAAVWVDSPNSYTLTNCTLRNSPYGFRHEANNPSASLTNCVFIGNTTAMKGDPGHSYCDFFDNTTNGTTLVGTDKTVDPGYQIATYGRGGALFLPSTSPLKGAGSGGADIGANILYEYVNGILTTNQLWPWPMEDRIFATLGQSPTYTANGGLFLTLTGLYSGGSPPPPPPPPPPPTGASLTGSFAFQGSGTINLTSEGTSDWIHMGYTNASSIDRKNAGGSQISPYTIIGSGAPAQDTTAIVGATWSDGAPDPSATNTTTGSRMLTPPGSGSPISHRLYVITAASIYTYDMDNNFALLKTVAASQLSGGIRGSTADPSTNTLYIAYGGDGGANGNGGLLAYDLLKDVVKYTKGYTHGVDQMAITPDGATIYMPEGEVAPGNKWYVVTAATGVETGKTISTGVGPHNTAISRDGTTVYMGPRYDKQMRIHTIATGAIQLLDAVTHGDGIRPFVFDNGQNWIAITETNFLGFEIFSLSSWHALYSVTIPGFTWNGQTVTCPCHGISMSPDETELYLLDWANNYVHVYDITSVPATAPTKIADIALAHAFGTESPCPYDCTGDGWLLHSNDGAYVFVGDSGDIISTATRAPIAYLDTLHNTRHGFVEVDFQNGVAIATTTHFGLGRG